MNVICLEFLEIFSSHYSIPFLLPQISLLAKIWFRKVCFSFVFSVFLLLFLQLICCCLCCLYSPPRFWSCVPLCCATSAVVRVTFAPSVRLYLVFLRASVRRFVLFFEVAVYFLLLLLLLWRCGSVLSWCFVVWWVLWLLSCCWCVLCVSSGCCVSCVGSVLFWLVRCSSGWLWWLCCSVRFLLGVVLCPWFCSWCVFLLRCFSCALHRPGVGSCVFCSPGGSWW